jgi:hypothetical protein
METVFAVIGIVCIILSSIGVIIYGINEMIDVFTSDSSSAIE